MTNEEYQNYPIENEGPDFRTILDRYLKYWIWFVGSVITAILIAFVYLTFKKSTYMAMATIIIEDEKSKGPSADASFAGLSMLGGISTSSIENELGLLRSKRLMKNAVKALKLNIQYFESNTLIKKEYYKNSPYLIQPALLDTDLLTSAKQKGDNEFTINFLNENEVEISFENGKESIRSKLGDIVELDYAKFFIEPNSNEEYRIKRNENVKGVKVVVSGQEGIASSIGSSLNVDLVDENSTMIKLSLVNEIPLKAKEVLDQLIFEYNQEAIEDKDLIARNTAFFIDERLAIINSELDSVETGKERFKEVNKLTDIQVESDLMVRNVSEYNIQQQEISTQLELTTALINHLKNNTANLLPANLGIDEAGTNGLIEEFNSIVLERNRLLKNANEKNPVLIGLDSQIEQIRNNVMESLNRREYNLNVKKNSLNRQAGILATQVSDVPAQERAYRGIERQQDIKEALYLFLLQKREENSLSLAAKAPKAKLVDQAYALGTPVSPNSKIVFTLALLMGLFLPFLVINIKSILNNKIMSSEDVKKLSKTLPVFGELPHILPKHSNIIDTDARSILSESFNILTSSIQHHSDKKISLKRSICIFVTSSIKGEGKTFTSVNIGITLASGGKKVLVIGADLRNPQLHRYENTSKNLPGLSEYLDSSNLPLDELIRDTNLNRNLKFLYTGTIPNNPIELLKKQKVGEMFEKLENEFDYIIVDTAPVLQLADTSFISKYADLTLYILRASFTKKNFVGFAMDAQSSGRLKNVGFVLNDVKLINTSYGNSYNYGT